MDSVEDWEVVEGGSGSGAAAGAAKSAVDDGSGLGEQDAAYFSKTFGVEGGGLVLREMVLFDSTQGWLYLSRRYLCFAGGLLRRSTVVLDLCDVTDVREEPWTVAGRVVSRSIVVSLSNGAQHTISTVAPFGEARAKLFRRLLAVWRAALEQAISIAETHEHSDVVDLLLGGRGLASAALTSSVTMRAEEPINLRRLKALERFRKLVRSNRFELIEVFSKGVALQLEGRLIVGSLYVSSCLAFASTHQDLVFFFHLSLVGIVETEDPSTIVFRLLKDEGLVVTFKLSAEADSNLPTLVKGAWRTEFQRICNVNSASTTGLPTLTPALPPYFSETMLADPKQFSPRYQEDMSDRLVTWKKYLLEYGRGSQGRRLKNYPFFVHNERFGAPLLMLHTTPAGTDFASLVRDGIPDALRGEMWSLCAGATMERLSKPGYYAQMLASAQKRNFNAARDIAKDVGRTLPHHPFYQTEDGLGALERVLSSYAFHNPRIGYTQSMNFLCGVLLLYMDEEAAFWMMVALCERINPHSYRKSMVGSLAQLEVFQRLLHVKLPELAKHLEASGFGVSMVATGWFMCLFISFMPWELCLRVLDNFFCLNTNIVFHVALALFVVNEQKLLETEQIEDFLRILNRSTYQAEEVMAVAYWLGVQAALRDEDVDRMWREELVRVARTAAAAGERDMMGRLGNTTYSRDEVSKLYERFRAALDPETKLGALRLPEFAAALPHFLPGWVPSEHLVLLLFTRLDKEHTGLVEFPQFLEMLSILERGTLEDKLGFLLELYCPEGDDKAVPSSEEVQQAVMALVSRFDCVLPLDELEELLRELPAQARQDRVVLVAHILRGLQKHGIGAANVESDLGAFELIEGE